MEERKNILDSINPAENPFRTPEGYFSDFQRNLEAKISGECPEAKEVSLFVKMRPWMYIAASFLAFVLCIQWYITGMVKVEKERAQVADTMEIQQHAEAAILYTYVDDLVIMNYLASDNE
jgi:hypothetical protein